VLGKSTFFFVSKQIGFFECDASANACAWDGAARRRQGINLAARYAKDAGSLKRGKGWVHGALSF
jgi:hypothetical protein